MNSTPLTNERLQQIRDADEAAGEDLRFCPPVWTERRELLGHIAALEEVAADKARLVRDLDVLLNGMNGAALTPSLCDIVGQVQKWVASGRIWTDEYIIAMRRQNIADAMAPQDHSQG